MKLKPAEAAQMVALIKRFEEGTLTEEDENLMVMIYMAENLKKGGASAILSKRLKGADRDEGLSP